MRESARPLNTEEAAILFQFETCVLLLFNNNVLKQSNRTWIITLRGKEPGILFS